MESDFGQLRQEMKAVLHELGAFGDTMEIREAQSNKLHQLIRDDMTIFRQDQRDLEEKLDCVICVMQHDLEALRRTSAENVQSIQSLILAIQDLRNPVAEIVALRARVAGVMFGIGLLGSALLWLAEPFYRWVVEHDYLKQ